MDLDLAQVRAFVVAAQELHFGRAAGRLHLTQQALSKRISRLESLLGAQLFHRHGHVVRLTDSGLQFLDPARQTLLAADHAVTLLTQSQMPLRMDVWGHLYEPMRTVRHVIDDLPEAFMEVGPNRDLASALAALERREIDVGFGRLHALPEDILRDYTHRLMRLEPVDVALSVDHPLAGRSELRPTDLHKSVLWCPAAVPRLEFFGRFAEAFGLATAVSKANLGLESFLDDMHDEPLRFTLVPAELELPADSRVCVIPLVDPTPLYAWSLIWRSDDRHPTRSKLLQAFARTGSRRRWLEYRPGIDWLPPTDSALLGSLGKAAP